MTGRFERQLFFTNPGAIPADFFGHKLLPDVRGHKDVFFGGPDYLAGQVTINDTPGLAYVRAHEEVTGLLVAAGWTKPDGSFRFDHLSKTQRYYVIAFDPLTGEQAAIFDRV